MSFKESTRLPIMEWIGYVEQLVGLHTGDSRITNMAWIDRLRHELDTRRPKEGRSGDPNLWMAAVMGAILVCWYLHIGTSKVLDTRRNYDERLEGAMSILDYLRWIHKNFAELSLDRLKAKFHTPAKEK